MEQFQALIQLIKALEELQIRYFITGSLASMAYGEPRLTNDADVVVSLTVEDVAKLKTYFPASEYYFDENQIANAILNRTQFNIIHPRTGFKIDVIIAKSSEFDRSRFARARRLGTLYASGAVFASPEDVIIKKMEYYKMGGSEKHLRDIAGIFKIHAENIDTTYIQKWASQLDLLDIWKAIQEKITSGS